MANNADSQVIHAPVLDWSTTPLENIYAGHYVKIIDHLFTAEECAALIKLAESDAEWQQAAVHYGIGKDKSYVDTEYRNSERILRFDHTAAEQLYQKLLPYVQELVEIKNGSPWEGIVGSRGHIAGKWKMIGHVQISPSLRSYSKKITLFPRINERLSFLRYGKGNFFRPHTDGQLNLPDGRKSRVTIQIYLGEDGVEGGATRILGTNSKYFDVEPKKGRVLIFQQRGIYHSGEEVTKGVKYAIRSDILFRQVLDEED